MALGVYSPSQVVCTIGGFPMQGKAEQFLKITMLSDAFKDKSGADGYVTRMKTNDLRATVEVTLAYGSASNAALSALYAADILSENGAGVAAFLTKDLNGNSLWTAEHIWVVKAPDIVLGAEPDDVTWVLRAAKMIPFVGGL